MAMTRIPYGRLDGRYVKKAGDIVAGDLTLTNTGLHILDTDASHDLILKPGSDLTGDKTLTLTTGDSDRTVTLSGNPTLNDWFDQAVKQASSPQFAALTVPGTISSKVGRAATLVVAASDSSGIVKAQADYICDEVDDQDEINAAIAEIKASGTGGTVLLAGKFIIHDTVVADAAGLVLKGMTPYGTEASGSPSGIFLGDGVNKTMIAATGLKLRISNLSFWGNKDNNSSGRVIDTTGGPSTQDLMLDRLYIFQAAGDNAIYWGTNHGSAWSVYTEYSAGRGWWLANRNVLHDCSSWADAGYGFYVHGNENSLIGCRVSVTEGDYAILVENARNLIEACQIWGSEKDAIRAYYHADNTILKGNIIYQPSQLTANTYSGIKLDDVENCVVVGNMIVDDTSKMKYGIVESGSADNNVIVNNNIQGAVTGSILRSGSNSKISGNVGHATEASGAATVASGQTSVDVSHGLDITPSINNIHITPTNGMGNATKSYISDVGASTFRINVDIDPGATTATFVWQIGSY